MNFEPLFSCPVFSSITAEKRPAFLERLDYSVKTFKKNERIANQGERIEYLYVLLQGRAKAEMISNAGTVLRIETIQAPDTLASAFLFAKPNCFPVDVTAMELCSVMLITKQSLVRQLSENEMFLQAYMEMNARRTIFLSDKLRLLTLRTIKGRLSIYILQHSKGLDFTLDMNQTQLAEFFCVSRPSLARSLSQMIADGVIEISKGKGKILNPNALKDLII
ncbi:MAG: Crp/Fnr family transcriptional regulator [Bacteroidales bacterium]|jgi:CRP-like cAMP-binding protein|nr:Crp/Fnr family transcriptional regulator [Bacteroidales bacterium]